jgi:uncharacterized membrane protein YcaP (DUF421 family)
VIEEESMFEMATPLWQVVVRTVVVYVGVLVVLRLAGKRELGQMTVFDLVLILLIANAVQNAMVGPDSSLQGGLVAAVVLVVCNLGVAVVRLRGGVWGRLIEGVPTVLIMDGRFVEPHMRRERLDTEDVERILREHGVTSVSDVKMAVLETDGSISIVPEGAQVVRTAKHVRQIKRK